jgi:hypothetical protein
VIPKISSILTALLLSTIASGAASTFPSSESLAPHAQSGSVQMYSCTQVGFSSTTCLDKALPSAAELAAFLKFCDKEAATGYHYLGASGNLSFNNINAHGSTETFVTYFLFEAP